MTETDEVIGTVYAGNLGVGMLGQGMSIRYIHKYRYKKEDREKIRTIKEVRTVTHFFDANHKPQVQIYGKVDKSAYFDYTTIPDPTTEILIVKDGQ